jgi:hypothetical protein
MRLIGPGWLAVLFACAGCSAGGGSAPVSRGGVPASYAAAPQASYGDEDYRADYESAPAAAPGAGYVGAPQAAPAGTPAPSPTTPPAPDAGPMLVYTAHLAMSVYRVKEVREGVIAAIREIGGVLTLETATQVTVRIPAARFQEALTRIEELGEVVSRNVHAQDVGEEFRDVGIRIETLEAMRRRVERLLDQAQDVQAALQVEQHLERITVELERLKGRRR